MKRQFSTIIILILSSLLFVSISQSQSYRVAIEIYPETGTDCDSDEAHFMWENINGYRTDTGIMPVAFSQTLCEIATEHLEDLIVNPSNNRQIRSDGTYLPDWLTERNYRQYPSFDDDDYVANMFVWISPELELLRNGINPGIVEWHWNRFDNNGLYGMMSNPNYREVGLAYRLVQGLDGVSRHYAVLIFGSQPGLFPVIPVQLGDDGDILRPSNPAPEGYTGLNYSYEATDLTIGLLFRTESIEGYGQGIVITDENGNRRTAPGVIHYFRYANPQENPVNCPIPNQPLTDGWMEYAQLHQHVLSGNEGFTTLYFQLCDGAGHDESTSITINYIGGGRIGTEEVTPEPTEEVTPEPTEEVTPEPTEEVTPEPTEEVTPEPTEEVTPEPTEEVTPEPTEEVTPEPTEEVTPEEVNFELPFGEIRISWQYNFMVIYNASDEDILLEDFADLRFIDGDGNELTIDEVIDRTDIDLFREERCMVVHDMNQRPTDEGILDFRWECDLEYGLTAWMKADRNDGRNAVWQTNNFDVYYGEVFITHCEEDTFTDMNECIIH